MSADAPNAEAYVSQVLPVLILRGESLAIAMLASAQQLSMNLWDDSDFYDRYGLSVGVPAPLYLNFSDGERDEAERAILDAAKPMHLSYVVGVAFNLEVEPSFDWRADAQAFLRGEGINNQGRVRSANMPSRQEDGLLFRSPAEVHVYQALKATGVTFAPLPVFLRGGKTYQRIEPDFVVYRKGAVMLIEVDGDTVHRETPAEADRRTQLFEVEGAFVRHIPAGECDSPEKAKLAVEAVLLDFKRVREAR